MHDKRFSPVYLAHERFWESQVDLQYLVRMEEPLRDSDVSEWFSFLVTDSVTLLVECAGATPEEAIQLVWQHAQEISNN